MCHSVIAWVCVDDPLDPKDYVLSRIEYIVLYLCIDTTYRLQLSVLCASFSTPYTIRQKSKCIQEQDEKKEGQYEFKAHQKRLGEIVAVSLNVCTKGSMNPKTK